MKELQGKIRASEDVLDKGLSTKNICFNFGYDKLGAKKLSVESTIHKRVRSKSDCISPKKETDIDKTKVYMELIESINELYKKMKINSEEKILLKKLITNSNKLQSIYQEAFIKGNNIEKDINIRNKLMDRLLIILKNMKEVDK